MVESGLVVLSPPASPALDLNNVSKIFHFQLIFQSKYFQKKNLIKLHKKLLDLQYSNV